MDLTVVVPEEAGILQDLLPDGRRVRSPRERGTGVVGKGGVFLKSLKLTIHPDIGGILYYMTLWCSAQECR